MHSTLLLYLIFNNRQANLAAVVFFLLSHAPSTLLELDKAAEDLTAVRDGCKSCQREIRTACRKRVLTPTARHTSSTEQTANMHQGGSYPLGTSCTSVSDLETSPLDFPPRDLSEVAPSGLSFLLEAQVESGCANTKCSGKVQ